MTTQISENHGYGDGFITHARAWLADCKNQQMSVKDGHQKLLDMLGELFVSGTDHENQNVITRLQQDGFEIGYDKTAGVVTIAYPALAYRTSRVIGGRKATEDNRNYETLQWRATDNAASCSN